MARSWIVLGGALIALVAGLAASALSRLRGADGSSILDELFGGSFGGLLFQLAFWLAVVALLAVIVTAVISLAHDASRIGRVRRRPTATTPEAKLPQPKEHEPPPGDAGWIELAKGCVDVIDELDQNTDSFDAPRREVADHVTLRLEEVLQRSGVEVIKDEVNFDRARHRPVPGGGAPPTGAIISATLHPGFAVGHRVLRRARVRVEGVTRDANW